MSNVIEGFFRDELPCELCGDTTTDGGTIKPRSSDRQFFICWKCHLKQVTEHIECATEALSYYMKKEEQEKHK